MHEFSKTQMGRQFLSSDIPKLIAALNRIADALEKRKNMTYWECGECGFREELVFTLEDAVTSGTPMCKNCLEAGRETEMYLLDRA